MPYIIMTIYLLLIAYFEYRPSSNNLLKKVFNYKIGFLILFLFAALRGNGNGDYQRYIEVLPQVNSFEMVLNPVDYPFEIGLRFIAYITNSLHLNPQFAIASMNAISFGAVFTFVEKRSENKGLSLFLFFPIVMLFDMHHSRSAVAMSLGLLFFDSLMDRKYLKSLLFIILSISFHKSGVVLLLLIPIAFSTVLDNLQMKLKNKSILKAIIILGIILFFYFVSPIHVIINLLDNPITSSIHYKLVAYLKNDRWSYPFSLIDPRLLISIFTYLVFDVTNKYKNKFDNKLQMIQLLTILTIVTLSISTILVIRTYNFFALFSIVLIPNLIKNVDVEVFRTQRDKYGLRFISENNLRLLLNLILSLIIFGYIIYTLFMIRSQFEYYLFF